MIENHRDLCRIPYFRRQPCPFENLKELIHDQGGILMRHRQIHGRLHDVSDIHECLTGSSRQNFLR